MGRVPKLGTERMVLPHVHETVRGLSGLQRVAFGRFPPDAFRTPKDDIATGPGRWCERSLRFGFIVSRSGHGVLIRISADIHRRAFERIQRTNVLLYRAQLLDQLPDVGNREHMAQESRL